MKKLLVANRSEIAVRICRAATELGLRTVAVYAREDRFGVHRFKADEAYLIGEDKGPVGAYLDADAIVALAKAKGVDLIHPGYGFLSENARFARLCREAGITFVGPDPEILERMGDKTAARTIAEQAGVPTIPGTPEPVSDPEVVAAEAERIGFPLIIKAAFGGGGRGMRVVLKPEELAPRLAEAQGEAAQAFGDPAVFLERYIGRAKHLEVQILGDRHGQLVHLHERDCSVQRRHQKVVEVAPSVGVPERVRQEICAAALAIGRTVGYQNAGTVEFLYDLDTESWYFIEVNPRIQVEHTVTECITGVDLVRAQILIAMGHRLDDPTVGVPPQAEIPRQGFAIQCRITTEDPEHKFQPDYGKILNYRSPAGFGVRLDGAMGDTGAVITPFYDSLLVKCITFAPTWEVARQRMDRALREFRIRGVKTNIPFLENVLHHPDFVAGTTTTTLIDRSPELLRFRARQDRATKLLAYLGEVVVNENPQVRGRPTPAMTLPVVLPKASGTPAPGTRDKLHELGPVKFAAWVRAQERLLITDTTFRDAHQSLLAARVRTVDLLGAAEALAIQAPGLFSLEMWGGATYDTCLRFLHEDPYERLARLRRRVPNILFQMLLRGANAVGYSNYPDNVVRGFVKHAAEAGIDLFRIFDSLNYLPNLRVAMEAAGEAGVLCEGTLCYTGDVLDPKREKYSLQYYVDLAKELEQMGAHIIAIKDMAGLCKPAAAARLVSVLRQEVGLPVHFHTHDASGIASASVLAASAAGADVVDLAIASLSGLTSQPNLNSMVGALRGQERDTGLDLDALNQHTGYWEAVRQAYEPFDTSPKFGSAEVYEHEMPGGQYTNLREQASSLGLGNRWPEVVKAYREVNLLLGDIVKVTPSSKVVGDMALFLVTRGIEPADVVNLEPGQTPFPASVIDLLSGGLGEPAGGWPPAVQRAVLGDRPVRSGRPGDWAPAVDLDTARKAAAKVKGSPATENDLYLHLMYPDVYAGFIKARQQWGDLSFLPTAAFFYGVKPGQEIAVEIEAGKRLYIKLISVGDPNPDGFRTVTFELNGRARETVVLDRSVKQESKAREKADADDPDQIGAPIPGLVAALPVSVGHKVKAGDKLVVLEAMKMQTTVYAPADGVVTAVAVKAGETVDAKDLLIRIKR